MTPKFRIYDKEVGYYVSNTRFLLSMDGMIYDIASENWVSAEERYLVEFMVGVNDKTDSPIFEGDKVFFDYNYIGTKIVSYVNGELNISKHVFSKCKIIGTIHDEKYKGL